MRVAIVSDTHVPSRAAAVPEWVLEEVRAADHTVHAGDFDAAETLSLFEDAAAELTAVTGNMDPAALDLPAVATVEAGGVEFVVTHGTGSLSGYEQRVRETVVEHGSTGAVGVSGHSHELMDHTLGGVRLLNPGSATGADPADEATMLRAEAAGGELDVEVLRE
ncbi:MAG: metallophosphoesterase family protein [Halobacteriaceae archaeon]